MPQSTTARKLASCVMERLRHEDRSDQELLRLFVESRDEAAFSTLVHRHAEMVLGVCQRIVRDRQIAEDVTQAVFLTLARKAKTLHAKVCIVGWLYEAARRCALKSRKTALRWSNAPRQVEEREDDSQPSEEILRQELCTVVDEEIHRLSSESREAIVLHYLEGRSYTEAARMIGCPRGTFSTRLSRARDQLRRRLGKRGWDLSTGLGSLLAPLCGTSSSPAWAEGIARTAKGVALGQAVVVRPEVLQLSKGVMMMELSKLKLGAMILTAVGIVGLATAQDPGPGSTEPLPSSVFPADSGAPPLPTGEAMQQNLRAQYLELIRKQAERMNEEQLRAALDRAKTIEQDQLAQQELDKARQILEELLKRYPNSTAADPARNALAALRNTPKSLTPIPDTTTSLPNPLITHTRPSASEPLVNPNVGVPRTSPRDSALSPTEARREGTEAVPPPRQNPATLNRGNN